MATKVKSERLLSQDFLKAVRRALPLCYVNLNLCSVDTISNFVELFHMIQLREEAVKVVLFLKYEWRGK